MRWGKSGEDAWCATIRNSNNPYLVSDSPWSATSILINTKPELVKVKDLRALISTKVLETALILVTKIPENLRKLVLAFCVSRVSCCPDSGFPSAQHQSGKLDVFWGSWTWYSTWSRSGKGFCPSPESGGAALWALGMKDRKRKDARSREE